MVPHDESNNNIEKSKEKIEASISHSYAETVGYSNELSKICRQLAFAEGALFWFSKQNLGSSITFLIIGFSILLMYFLFDALQYLAGLLKFQSQADQKYRDYKVNKIYDEDNYEIPYKFHLTDLFFYIKLIMIFLSSITLIYAFLNGLK